MIFTFILYIFPRDMVSQQYNLKARNHDYTLGMQYVNDIPIELGHIVPDDNNRYLRIIWKFHQDLQNFQNFVMTSTFNKILHPTN